MGLWEKFKSGTKTINELVNLTDVEKLLKEIEETKKENESLKEKLKDKNEWKYNKRYNLVNENGREICGTCYEVENLKVTISEKDCSFGKITYQCPKCKNIKTEDIKGFDMKAELEKYLSGIK